MPLLSRFSKHTFLFAFLALAYVCLSNASPIVQPNDVTPPPSPSSPPPAKAECNCAKKPLTDPTTTTTPTATLPSTDKVDKTIKTDKYRIFVEPIGNGKEAIYIPEIVHASDHHKDVYAGTTSALIGAAAAAKKQAILNQSPKYGYPDDDDWDTDVPRDHYRSHFNRFNDRQSNYL